MSAGETAGLGWSPEGLEAAFEFAASLSTDALVIATKDRTVASFGNPGRAYDVHSIRKALLSAVMGQHIGTGRGRISVADTLGDLNVDEAPRPLTVLQKTATVRHLLKSVSGINRPAVGEGGLTAEKDRLLGKGENTPGTRAMSETISGGRFSSANACCRDWLNTASRFARRPLYPCAKQPRFHTSAIGPAVVATVLPHSALASMTRRRGQYLWQSRRPSTGEGR